jgi:hypothetical protein
VGSEFNRQRSMFRVISTLNIERGTAEPLFLKKYYETAKEGKPKIR